MHVLPGLQALPHVPQFCPSVWLLVHSPAQLASPPAHEQAPAVHALPAAQAVLQLPQCRLSELKVTQSAPHWARPLAQVALAPDAPALELFPALDSVLVPPVPLVPLVVAPAVPPAPDCSLAEPDAPGEPALDSVSPM